MLRSRTIIHFAILIGMGLVGVIVARNFGSFQSFLRTVNLRHTFESECLAADCPDAIQADALDPVDRPDDPEASRSPKATVDTKEKKR